MARAGGEMLDREVYGIGQAADLLGLRGQKVRAWLDGYERKGKVYPPVIREEPTGSDLVTWGEFVELGYLREYRHAGVSLQSLRPVIADLREHYQTQYPLAELRPYVSDHELVMKLQDQHAVAHEAWMVVRTGQGLLLAGNAEAFFRKVEFSPGDQVERLLPAGKESAVSVDPEVSFGMPNVGGVSTERIFELWSAEGEDVDWVAESYDLEGRLVRDAIMYEETARSLAA